MKKLIFGAMLLGAHLSFAAIAPTTELAEVLSLPEPLRNSQVKGRETELYPKMIGIAFSKKQSVEIRWKALTMAAYLKKQKAVPDLKKALVSNEWFMRNAALISLQSVSKTEGRVAAESLLTDKALVVRSAAVDVLAADMDGPIRELFWQAMNSKNNFRGNQSLWIREQLLGHLAKNPEISEKTLFQNLSQSSTPAMKILAKNALTQLK